MKKIFLGLLSLFLITGCGNGIKDNPIEKFKNNINKCKSYSMSGTMELINDEEKFTYNIEVDYLKDANYKVSMINSTNNHEQIILRNDTGLYVITPSLNKSFKFESNWPDNSSQSYILSSLINDVNNDNKVSYEKKNDEYIIKSKVNYPNNSDLQYQKIYLNDNMLPNKIEVYGKSDIVKITVKINNIDINSNLNKDYFKLDNYIKEKECEDKNCESKETMSKIESAIYPLYMPSNTYLSNSEVVNNDSDSRVILTFSGDKNFVLVEEGIKVSNDHEIVPVYGEPIMLNNTIGALSNNSMFWTSNDIDYYLVSDDLSVSEMVFVASSLTNAKKTMLEK